MSSITNLTNRKVTLDFGGYQVTLQTVGGDLHIDANHDAVYVNRDSALTQIVYVHTGSQETVV